MEVRPVVSLDTQRPVDICSYYGEILFLSKGFALAELPLDGIFGLVFT